MINLPVYLHCRFFKNENKDETQMYKIDKSGVTAHPFQLFKLSKGDNSSWENLSVYATPDHAIMISLKQLFPTELAEEVDHGQAIVNPSEIMEKFSHGEKSITLYSSSNNEGFRQHIDVDFESLIKRK